jgi:hypothetical protein
MTYPQNIDNKRFMPNKKVPAFGLGLSFILSKRRELFCNRYVVDRFGFSCVFDLTGKRNDNNGSVWDDKQEGQRQQRQPQVPSASFRTSSKE